MKVYVFSPNIVTDIIFYRFEAGQKLVRSRAKVRSHFCRTDNANFVDFFGSIIVRDRTTLLTTDTAPIVISEQRCILKLEYILSNNS